MRPSGRCVLIVSSAALLLGGACSTPAQPQAQPTTSRNMWQPPERETASDADYLCVAPSLARPSELSERIRELERLHGADRRAEIVAAALAQRREIVFELLPDGARLDARDTRKYFPPDVIDVPSDEQSGGRN